MRQLGCTVLHATVSTMSVVDRHSRRGGVVAFWATERVQNRYKDKYSSTNKWGTFLVGISVKIWPPRAVSGPQGPLEGV